MRVPKRLATLAVAAVAVMTIAGPVLAADSTIVVRPTDMATTPAGAAAGNWLFYQDDGDFIDGTLGSFVSGPGTPPAGVGSVQISTSGTSRPNLATYRFSGTPLASITTLKFSTYNPSAGNPGSSTRSAYLHFNVDFNGTDAWQRRLVFVPSQNGTVIQDQWQEWDAIAGGAALWGYSGGTWPVTGGTGLKTWSQILTDYAGVRIRVTDSFLGLRVGEPYADGYTENIDAFKFGTASGTTTFDFEPNLAQPASKNACKGDGWQTYGRPDNSTFKNQGDCIQWVNTGK